jgi:hypothetical protein
VKKKRGERKEKKEMNPRRGGERQEEDFKL